VQGCTHLRELLFNMATAAFQTIPHHREKCSRRESGADAQGAHRAAVLHGQVHDLGLQRPGGGARVAPQFIGWKKAARVEK
jgi:hypothetical protein